MILQLEFLKRGISGGNGVRQQTMIWVKQGQASLVMDILYKTTFQEGSLDWHRVCNE